MIKPKQCKECGKSFTPKYSTLENVCSQDCKVKLQKPKVVQFDHFKKPTIKTCKICKSKFTPKNVIAESFCQEYKCKVAYAMGVVEKNKKAAEKKFKEKLKDNTTKWNDVLQKEVNKIVRAIDKGLPCLARNINGQIHAGHVYARGGNSTIRYNLHNIHRQCAQSNHWQNDDGLLREGVTKEYGQEYMCFISSLRQTPQLTYKPLEYKELSLKARKIALSLNKAGLNYDLVERVDLRNKINLQLGIYHTDYCVYNY